MSKPGLEPNDPDFINLVDRRLDLIYLIWYGPDLDKLGMMYSILFLKKKLKYKNFIICPNINGPVMFLFIISFLKKLTCVCGYNFLIGPM